MDADQHRACVCQVWTSCGVSPRRLRPSFIDKVLPLVLTLRDRTSEEDILDFSTCPLASAVSRALLVSEEACESLEIMPVRHVV